ncbi:hypothetical protein RJ639_008316 [Escallonia herrerae]|uniref:NB-ARC domain-containing protein n=1 Tax=Escallonia herrerae TaxID=1293975 RepID=A0AA88VV07_9ASTE|nr:hypothetical protein RJ639_008316 [Escallonia herrerae]
MGCSLTSVSSWGSWKYSYCYHSQPIMRSWVPDYHLEQLGNEEICSILAHHARGWQNFDAHPGFKEIGEAIAKKCQGLPLAAKSLGGLLRAKGNPNDYYQGHSFNVLKRVLNHDF